jgi:hypothetical protein
MTIELKKSSKLISFDSIALILYALHILFNFMELPQIKYFYLLEVAFFMYGAFTKRWNDLLIPTFVFFFIEGQGRILSNYNFIMRNIFDIYLLVILAKSTIIHKKLIDFNKTPKFFTILILLHFGWYFAQIFNYQNVSPIAVLAGAKIYILPILFFLMFLREGMDLKKYNQRYLLNSFLFIIISQAVLVIYQMQHSDPHLLAISPHYSRIMRDVFVKHLFRPFGTSFISGGISVHFAYITAILFLFRSKTKLQTFFKIIAIIAMIFACFIMQVRTALIQLILIAFCAGFIQVLISRFRLVLLPLFLSTLLLIPLAIDNSKELDILFPKLQLGQSIARLEVLSDIQSVKGNRASPELFYETLVDKLTKTPFGLGPGRTGAANAMFVDKINSDVIFDMQYSWTLDNLFISLAIDFGWGMIFYSLLIILLPLYLLWRSIMYVIKGDGIDVITTTCAIVTLSILASCWGAIAIPYNPSSFFFWFFLSIAINEILQKERKLEKANL